MDSFTVTTNHLADFAQYLQAEEREPGTIAKYLQDMRAFSLWLGNRALTKAETSAWKTHLRGTGYQPDTINSMLAALNKFVVFLQLSTPVRFCSFSLNR